MSSVMIHQGTTVYGCDPNRPSALFAAVKLTDRSNPKPFAFKTAEFYQNCGMTAARQKLERFLHKHGLDHLQSDLPSPKTVNEESIKERLDAIARDGPLLLNAYTIGPSRKKNKRNVPIQRPRVIHRFARRLASHGRREIFKLGDGTCRMSGTGKEQERNTVSETSLINQRPPSSLKQKRLSLLAETLELPTLPSSKVPPCPSSKSCLLLVKSQISGLWFPSTKPEPLSSATSATSMGRHLLWASLLHRDRLQSGD